MRVCDLPARSDSVTVTAHGPVALEVGETVPVVTLVSGTYLKYSVDIPRNKGRECALDRLGQAPSLPALPGG